MRDRLSYGGNDGYDSESPRSSKIVFYIGIAVGVVLAAWMYASMFMEVSAG